MPRQEGAPRGGVVEEHTDTDRQIDRQRQRGNRTQQQRRSHKINTQNNRNKNKNKTMDVLMAIIMTALAAAGANIIGILMGRIDCGIALYIAHTIEMIIKATQLTLKQSSSSGSSSSHAFKGRIVWITGASQGVGRDIAMTIGIHESPYAVILTARNKAKLTSVVHDIEAGCARLSKGAPIIVICCIDLLGSADTIASALAKHLAVIPNGTERGVETCVCCVGVSQRASVVETEDNVDSRMTELCCFTATKCIKLSLVLGKMLAFGRGCIVVVNSMAGIVPSPGQASYSMAKHALRGWTETLRSEVKKRGIQVTSLCPGPLQVKREMIGTGQSNTRLVMGPKLDKMVEISESGGGKIAISRAVSLMMTAVKWNFSEVWIAGKPVLLIAYVYAFCAPLGRLVLNMVGPKRAKAAMLGTDVYSANNLFSK